ncbi:MAG: hypothetical protein J1F63_00650 [Oscillospiraceae bacterium]|nr:hypothetical protein [Oscillospiraceae bacterium]
MSVKNLIKIGPNAYVKVEQGVAGRVFITTYSHEGVALGGIYFTGREFMDMIMNSFSSPMKVVCAE